MKLPITTIWRWAGIWLVGLALAPVSPAASNGVVRVVSLAPCLTEIICAIGASDCLVGRSSACNYPPDVVKRVPVAGNFGIPALEALANCAPNLVVTVDLEDQNAVQAIEHLGIRHASIPCRSLDDIPRAMRTVGKLLHREESAEKLANKFADTLAGLRKEIPSDRRRVFIEIWGDPLTTAGKLSFLNELVELAGGANIAGDVARDYFQISPETVLARDPEVIVLLESTAPAVAKRTGWQQMSAVRTGHVCGGLDGDLLEVPGPRVLEAVAVLRGCIFGVRRLVGAGPAVVVPSEQQSGSKSPHSITRL